MERANRYETSESMHGLSGEDLDSYLENMVVPVPETYARKTEAGKLAVGQHHDIIDNPGFYQQYVGPTQN